MCQSPFQRVLSLANQCCHDTGEPLPALMTDNYKVKYYKAGDKVKTQFRIIDYGHTGHCQDCKEVCLCERTTQRTFWEI